MGGRLGRVGPYALLERLGRGGMGEVYLAATKRGEQVALKMLREAIEGDADARLRLDREVRALRRVESPYVARVLDADLSGDRPYLVMEHIAGDTLLNAVKRDGPLPEVEVIRLARGLATALAIIHAAGIVHRDLKPANVLIGDEGPVLIDFGIAQVLDATRMTQTGTFLGTPGYAAPELFAGEQVGEPADLHAWAATVAFAATGRPTFGGGSAESQMYAILHGKADLKDVPPALLPQIRAALNRDPAKRPTAAILADRMTRLARAAEEHDAREKEAQTEGETPRRARGRETAAVDDSGARDTDGGRRRRDAAGSGPAEGGRRAGDSSGPNPADGRRGREAAGAGPVDGGRRARDMAGPGSVDGGRRGREAAGAGSVDGGRRGRDAAGAGSVDGGRRAQEAAGAGPAEGGRRTWDAADGGSATSGRSRDAAGSGSADGEPRTREAAGTGSADGGRRTRDSAGTGSAEGGRRTRDAAGAAEGGRRARDAAGTGSADGGRRTRDPGSADPAAPSGEARRTKDKAAREEAESRLGAEAAVRTRTRRRSVKPPPEAVPTGGTSLLMLAAVAVPCVIACVVYPVATFAVTGVFVVLARALWVGHWLTRTRRPGRLKKALRIGLFPVSFSGALIAGVAWPGLPAGALAFGAMWATAGGRVAPVWWEQAVPVTVAGLVFSVVCGAIIGREVEKVGAELPELRREGLRALAVLGGFVAICAAAVRIVGSLF
ncbi:protein kinase [Herbidospora sp. NEAU-GS84]|uniref:Protein kinase n=1 Tax=Herbidospora solisilvae TaxID=2696284 RepID=A0A7C9NYZ4_9ACTN|nr:serine/threonine protein kinase [Herbidospora solisilvae]NAS21217.1 protein kinase [Herbidospora solisilvae]